MIITEQSIVGDLVANDYRTALVLKDYGIDFCCRGNRTLTEACLEKNIDVRLLVEKLMKLEQEDANNTIDYNTWPIDLLADYIEKTHHRYVETKIGEIKPLLRRIVEIHGSRHPELIEIENLFGVSAGELTVHMKKEEFILFPFIRKMVNSKSTKDSLNPPAFGTVKNPIGMMQHDHDTEGERFRAIALLTENYTPPKDACNTYRAVLSMLMEFETDLHRHIHLENNILFPKAIKLEQYFAVQ